MNLEADNKTNLNMIGHGLLFLVLNTQIDNDYKEYV